jgi:hypothetical protein
MDFEQDFEGGWRWRGAKFGGDEVGGAFEEIIVVINQLLCCVMKSERWCDFVFSQFSERV